MNSDESLNGLLCAISNEDKHFVNTPISLQCGHCICKKCVSTGAVEPIKCFQCGQTTDRDLRYDSESVTTKMLIKFCLSSLFTEIEKQTTDSIEKLKNLHCEENKSVDAHFKYISDEIEIRIESLKQQLDELHKQFKDKLGKVKNEIENENKDKFQAENSPIFETKLKELRKDIEKNNTKNEQRLYEYQDNLSNIKRILKQFQDFSNYKPEFKPSDDKLSENLIGEISSKTFLNQHSFILHKIMRNTYENFAIQVLDICVIANDQLVASTNNNSISIFDENFDLIKRIERIDEKPIYSFGVAFNPTNNKIYASNWSNDCVYMLDLTLNKIKSFGSQGMNNNNLYRPFGICIDNDLLYICDASNQRIQILNSDLVYIGTINLNYVPYTIKISKTSICVCGSNCTLNFYDLNTRVLKEQYTNVSGRINEIDSIFYFVTFSPTKKLCCYDTDGNFLEEIDIEQLSQYVSYVWDGLIINYNNSLILANNKGNVLKF